MPKQVTLKSINEHLTTRHGCAVKIYTTSSSLLYKYRSGKFKHTPIVGVVHDGTGNVILCAWDAYGVCLERGADFDLVHPAKVFYVNVYNDGYTGCTYNVREEADLRQYRRRKRIACINYEEGQFDD